MPNDAKRKLDEATHRLQDQPTTVPPAGAEPRAGSHPGQDRGQPRDRRVDPV
jgi:hypothetical protein